jgi:hypothetical protein
VFHAFTREFLSIANSKEAGRFRIEQNERQRVILGLERKRGAVLLYGAWRVTSNYGESFGRWALTCIFSILIFAGAFWAFGAVASNSSLPDKTLGVWDYIYFSVTTFSTLGYGDLHPVGTIGRALACLDVFAGLTMFGVLLSFILNKVQRN